MSMDFVIGVPVTHWKNNHVGNRGQTHQDSVLHSHEEYMDPRLASSRVL